MVSPTPSRRPSTSSQPLLNPRDRGSHGNVVYGTPSQQNDHESNGQAQSPFNGTGIRRELKILGKSSIPLVATSLLSYFLSIITVFVAGHIGVDELAAVSLALMTANITAHAVYEGLATGLDTLCAQAYGAGSPELVGFYVRQMACFLLLATIPIGMSSPWLLAFLVPEQHLATMAGHFLRVLLLGAPGFALFEAGKRFVQAQGLFNAALFVMLITLPVNIFLNWLFVYRLDWGFTGAALALALTRDLLPFLLLGYILYINPASLKCWTNSKKSVFRDWSVMLKISIPGLVMVEAEWLAFELLTLAASYLSTTQLAAHSVVMTVCIVMAHVPASIAIAVCTRLGNLVGSKSFPAAKMVMRIYCAAAIVVGLIDALILTLLRTPIVKFFTTDEAVIVIASKAILVLAIDQIFESTNAIINGMLRGLGKQSTGAWINLLAYYLVSLRIRLGTI